LIYKDMSVILVRPELPPSHIREDLIENMLYVSATSRHACPIGTGPKPTPPAHHSPKKPVKPATVPAAIRSPNPHHVVSNDTHVAVIDWQTMQEPVPARSHQIIEYPEGDHTYFGTSHVTWWSWNTIRCPPSYVCPEGYPAANYWVCWFDELFESYCHPAGLKTVPGSRVELKTPGHLDSGFYLTYEGVYKTHLKLNVSCVPWGSPNTILFQESVGRYYYNPNNGEAEWSYDTSASYVCPHPVQVGTAPNLARPQPPRNPVQQFQVGGMINDQHVGLNLKKFSYLQGKSLVGSGIDYHWAEWHYSPWELIGCPADHNCGVYANDEANVWECVGQKLENCFPIGDRRYDLTVDFLNHTNELAGIKAAYGGGAPGYAVQVDWQCNDSVEFGTVYFNHYVREESNNHSIVLWAHTHEVCPGREWGQVRPGAVFLVIVGVAFFGFFVLGTFVKYIVTGEVSFIFDGFWSEVSDSLTAAVTFLVTCGKGQAAAGGAGASTYNDI
jgi:hypothetical protein